ncbi:MAG: helix-turn-helix transcriptional regulator [Clostridia bacterium]|nr:helix-turn-helix transcriptional regulator [Clostridia bacterium]MBQ3057752.1 helix-turn-helix transcriptional regulator [Clostridia bacterium]
MDDIKHIVAKNITELRLLNNMTQMELAEKINYSDKTISKWERAESSPDISVLVQLADLFGVSLDYLVRSENIDETVKEHKQKEVKYNRKVICYISESVVWFVAIFAFIITSLITNQATFQWLYFVYALPIVLIIRLIFNSIWFNPRRNYLIISALIWSVLSAIHITFLHFGLNVSLIFLLGIAGQIVIILWSFIKKPKLK